MKLIIVCKARAHWLNEKLPGQDPFLLKICNKNIIEYYIELSEILGIDDILLLCGHNYSAIRSAIGNGDNRGKNIKYNFYPSTLSSKCIERNNKGFLNGDTYLLIKDLMFTYYDIQNPNIRNFIDSTKNNLISKRKNTTSLFATRIDSLSTYYNHSRQILLDYCENYSLTNYQNINTPFLGNNLTISKSSIIHPKAMIGDGCVLGNNVIIGEGCIIGANSHVGDNTTIENSIILPNTNIIANSSITNKIIDGNTIVDTMTGKQTFDLLDISA